MVSFLIYTHQIIRIILFGATALNEDHHPKNNTSGKKLGIKFLTPGLVALAALLVSAAFASLVL